MQNETQQKKKPTPEELDAALDDMSEVLFGQTGPNQRLAASVLINGNAADRTRQLFQSRWDGWSATEPKRQAAMEKLLGAIEVTGTSLTQMMLEEGKAALASPPKAPIRVCRRWGVVVEACEMEVTLDGNPIPGVVKAEVDGMFLSLRIDMTE